MADGKRLARRGAVIAAVALALGACGGARFHRVGPTTPAATAAATAAGGSPIAIERIELRWSNAYLISREGAAVLVDSGSPPDRGALRAALEARGALPPRLRAVVITHAHADHAGCARWLQAQGAAIVLGAGDAGPAGRGQNERLRPTGLLGALLAPTFMFPFEPFTADVAVEREQDLAAYGFPELRVVPVAGHTPGSLAVLLGDEAFVGDMVKGGELLKRSPTEHLYQTDRLADHQQLEGLLARGATRLYLGHSGPLDGAETRAWLADARGRGRDTAIWLELDARGELGDDLRGGSGGLRARYAIGRATAAGLGYVLGIDARAGALSGAAPPSGALPLDGAYYAVDAFPIGLAVRSAGGAALTLAVGAGLGGPRGAGASHALAELAAELPAGPLHLLARGSLGIRLGGPPYLSGLIDYEPTALAGVRLGRDRAWGEHVAGRGPYLAVTYRQLGELTLLGLALGVDLFAGR